MHVSAGLKQKKPANQKVQSDSPPRPVTTFPLLSHIFGGFNLTPRVEQKFYRITNKYRHMTSAPKGVSQRMGSGSGWVGSEKSYKNL